jgi:drug/metabolite transporter (DMT)-like permease
MNTPALRGGALALAAAVLFGLSTPLVKHFGQGIGAFITAALMGWALRQPVEKEARLMKTDVPRLLAVAAFGAVLGPVALAWGLQRTDGTSASLMLTLEALFTALLAGLLYGESMDRRVKGAMLLILAGGLMLVLDQGRPGSAGFTGMLAVLAATAAWGVDNSLSRALAERDPGQVVMAKAALGASATAALGLVAGEPLPGLAAGLALLAIGATGYGLSLRFYLLAQRGFGAARTGSVFAFAPFIGAVFALTLGGQHASWMMAAGAALLLAGVMLHLLESHQHEHAHEALQHEHAHTHGDGHHNHQHAQMPKGSHSHAHVHTAGRHAHAHVPDAHHQHSHTGAKEHQHG